MKKTSKTLMIILSSLLAFCVGMTESHAANSVPRAVINASRSVYRIVAEYKDGYGLGSGFVICKENGDTYIATNYHVVSDRPSEIYIIDEAGSELSASIAASDKKKDLAILKVSNSNLGTALVLDSSNIQRGDAIYAVGFPGAADYISNEMAYSNEDATITNGIVSTIRQGTTLEDADVTFIQITAPINSGNSGGPLFDSKGRVVGINTYGAEGAQGIYWSISIDQINPLTDKLEFEYHDFISGYRSP